MRKTSEAITLLILAFVTDFLITPWLVGDVPGEDFGAYAVAIFLCWALFPNGDAS